MTTISRQLGRDIRELARSAFGVMRTHRLRFLLFAAGALAAVVLLQPYDVTLYHRLADDRSKSVRRVARRVSYWGDLQRASVILAVAVWGAGLAVGRRDWQKAAAASLLAALLAGLFTNLVRPLLGRARPSTEVPAGFYGPHFTKHYHSFPSAHATTSFATASALAVALPPVGVPVLAGAACVGWSRMYMREHYLTDVIAGAAVGIWFGVAFGLAARRKDPIDAVQKHDVFEP
jgi:membrane-associated phospholipid phosphatase